MEALTNNTLPKVLKRNSVELIEKKDFEYLPDEPLIAGKTIVVNAVGRMFVYMGDDMRSEQSKQIIVADWGGNLYYLTTESKKAISLKF